MRPGCKVTTHLHLVVRLRMSGGIHIFSLYDFMTLTETTLPSYEFQFGTRRIKKSVAPPTGSEQEPSDVHSACVGCDVTLLPWGVRECDVETSCNTGKITGMSQGSSVGVVTGLWPGWKRNHISIPGRATHPAIHSLQWTVGGCSARGVREAELFSFVKHLGSHSAVKHNTALRSFFLEGLMMTL